MKKFIPDFTLTKTMVIDRIQDMDNELTKFNHEKEAIDKQINVLKNTRGAILRKFGKADTYKKNLQEMLKSYD